MNRQETLIATAKALALPVVDWVAESEPLGYLLGNRTWEELAALAVVLAEAADRDKLAGIVAASDGHNGEGRGYATKWSRPDDGIVDDVAIERVAAGESTTVNPVPLSPPERLRVAEVIASQGGGSSMVAKRLHVNGATAWDLLGSVAEANRASGTAGAERSAAA